MHYYKVITMVFILSIKSAYAQDSTFLLQQYKTLISPLSGLQEDFYSSPALKPYQRNYSYSILAADYYDQTKDLFIRQQGSGHAGLKVHSSSYQQTASGTTLWGEAYYNKDKIRRVNFNESLDYNLIYPYVMADTVGGDLSTETYYFSGGLAKKLQHFNYAFNVSFKGVQGYRDVDPRPNNISSDLRLALSLSKELAVKYVFSADLTGQKYNQKNSLGFANQLGVPLVFHLSGLGMYNQLLAGSRTSATYEGFNYGLQLNLVPALGNGFIIQAGIDRQKLDKNLSSIIKPIAEVADDTYHALVGYTTKAGINQYAIKLKAAYKKREGTEGKFATIDASLPMQKISEDLLYTNEQTNMCVEAAYGRDNSFLSWYLGAELGYESSNEAYANPKRYLNYSNLRFGLNLSATKSVKATLFNARLYANKAQNLSADYSWSDVNVNTGIYGMLNDNYTYLIAGSFNFGGSLQAAFPVSQKLNLFVTTEGGYTGYENHKKGAHLLFSTGFIF